MAPIGSGKPGIWTMEGDWSSKVSDVRTVTPVLKALMQSGYAKYAMRRLNDADDVAKEFQKWSKYSSYNIGYLALHGSPGHVYVGKEEVDLHELGKELQGKANLKHKILHFGSCSVLDMPKPERESLRKSLGIKILTGFTRDVEWVESLAFELLAFGAFTWYKQPASAEKYIDANYGQLKKRLGFVIVR